MAAGDVNGDGQPTSSRGRAPAAARTCEIFSGADLSVLASFFAYDPAFGGGVHVAAGDVNGDGVVDVILGAGPGGGPHVRILSGADLSELASFFAPGGGSGVSVGSLGDEPGVRFTSAAATSFLVGSAGTLHDHDRGQPAAGDHVERHAAGGRDLRRQRRRHRHAGGHAGGRDRRQPIR